MDLFTGEPSVVGSSSLCPINRRVDDGESLKTTSTSMEFYDIKIKTLGIHKFLFDLNQI